MHAAKILKVVSILIVAISVILSLCRPAKAASNEQIIHAFQLGSDGGFPTPDLLRDAAGNLYGATEEGGDYSLGTVFELSPQPGGWTEQILYSFQGGSDGDTPSSGIIVDAGGNLYGETLGGANSAGTIYELSPSKGSWTKKESLSRKHRLARTLLTRRGREHVYCGMAVANIGLDYLLEIREAVRHPRGAMESAGTNISTLIELTERGDAISADKLFSVLYGELHQLARYQLAREGSSMSLTPTTLLHQAYLDIAEREGPSFPDRARFMGYAARVMRNLIIDHARNQSAQKRGGLFEITSLSRENIQEPADERELTQISDVLDRLAKTEPALAEVVDLKFFCGFSFAEIAAMRNLSERTVQRHWKKARIYLHRHLRTDLSS